MSDTGSLILLAFGCFVIGLLLGAKIERWINK